MSKTPAPFQFSNFTAAKEVLTKSWRLDATGKPIKIGAGEMTRGSVRHVTGSRPSDLRNAILSLKKNQALCWGVPPGEEHNVVTKEALPKAPAGTIARTAETMSWPAGPGVLMLDYDPRPGAPALTLEQLHETLIGVCPALEDAPTLWAASASSEIYNTTTGEQVAGIRGQRIYFIVEDASDIPRAGKVLFDLLILAGHGYCDVSRSGRLLLKTVIDKMVWQTNRLDFMATAVCEPPLECRRPDPKVLNNDKPPIDTRVALPDLTPEETKRLAEIRTKLRRDPTLLAEQAAAIAKWSEERRVDLLAKGIDPEKVERILRAAVEHCQLAHDFELTHSSGEVVTVGELLADRDKWHKKEFHDPLEPEYGNNDKRIAVALLDGQRPIIYSHAHGGINYELLVDPEVVLAGFEPVEAEPAKPIGGPYDFATSTAALRELDIKIEYLVDPVIPKGFITLIFAPGGLGKSTLAHQLCQSVQDGTPFFGLPTAQADVFYLDYENPLPTIAERVKKIGGNAPFPLWHSAGETPPPQIDDIKGREILFGIRPGSLLVIDTLKASNNADENSSKEMKPLMDFIKELRRYELTIVILHHTPKTADGTPRGSSVITDQVDHCVCLSKVKAAGSDQEIDDDAEGVIYRLGTKGKTRAKPFKMFLTFDPATELFTPAVDPKAEQEREHVAVIANTIRRVTEGGDTANQSRIIREINGDPKVEEFRGAIIPTKRIIELLRKGEGVLWETTTGEKNAKVYQLAFSPAVVSVPIPI